MTSWPMVPLGEVTKPKQWRTLAKSEMKSAGFPVYGANGQIGYFDTYTHEHPTILVGCRGSCGTVHVTPPRSYANGNAMALDGLDESRVELRFLMHFLRYRGFADVTTGASQPQIVLNRIVGVLVPLPPLQEQRRVAEILDRAGTLQSSRKMTIALLDEMAQACFVALFGDPTASHERWPLRCLKDLGKITTGATPPSVAPGMFGGAVPFVTPGDLESGLVAKRTLTEEGVRQSRAVRAGSTLVCCIGATIGKIGYAEVRSAFNQQINAIEWRPEVDDRYGLEVMRFNRATIIARGASTTLPILKKSAFEQMLLPVPPLAMQEEFAHRMAVIDRNRAAHRTSLRQLDAVGASLQHLAFRGEL